MNFTIVFFHYEKNNFLFKKKNCSVFFRVPSSTYLKAIYCAQVSSSLNTAVFHGTPYITSVCAVVERVQRKFLRIAAHRLNILHPHHNFTPVLRVLNISTLADC